MRHTEINIWNVPWKLLEKGSLREATVQCWWDVGIITLYVIFRSSFTELTLLIQKIETCVESPNTMIPLKHFPESKTSSAILKWVFYFLILWSMSKKDGKICFSVSYCLFFDGGGGGVNQIVWCNRCHQYTQINWTFITCTLTVHCLYPSCK